MRRNSPNNKDYSFPAIVLGLFETGLAVGRSLGRNNIPVYGIDTHKDIGFYSKYIKGTICPDPSASETKFATWFINYLKSFREKPILFFTSDVFLGVFSQNRDQFHDLCRYNIPAHDLLFRISNKYEQYQLIKNHKILVPETRIIDHETILNGLDHMEYPLFLKGMDVVKWRAVFGGTKKGILIQDSDELIETAAILGKHRLRGIMQEVVKGPDTNHFKYCVYRNSENETLNQFMLQKIRQHPAHFGVGSAVKSVFNKDLQKAGRELFTKLKYSGVGSAEFKYDERDGNWKLIEVNPRYWQQYALTEYCKNSFSLNQYLDLTGQNPLKNKSYDTGKIWVNIYMDFSSYLQYRKESGLNFLQWIRSLKGKKIFPDFAWDDIIPVFYESRFGKRFLRLPLILYKRYFGRS